MHADAVVYRAGQGGATGATDADPITTEVIRHGLNSAANQIKRALVRTVLLAHHLRGTRLRSRRLRPAVPAARTGAEPSLLHGDHELLHRIRGGGGGRRGRARAGRHRPHERPVPDRFAPAGRGDGDAGVPRRRHPDRLLGDQGALDGHRRPRRSTARTRPTFSRRASSSRASSSTPRASWSATSGEWRLRELTPGEVRRGRHQRRGRRACAPGRPTSCGSSQRFGLERFHESVERMYDHGEAVVRSYFEQIPDGRYVGRGEMDSRRHHGRPDPVRGRARGGRLDVPARLLERAGRAPRTGQLSARLDRVGRTRAS